MLERVHLVFDLLKILERGKRSFMHRHSLLEVYVLIEQSEIDTASAHNVAAVRRLFAADHAEERRLTRAVATDETYVLARIYLQRRPTQNVLRAIGFMNL
jgi:hypothetical protein